MTSLGLVTSWCFCDEWLYVSWPCVRCGDKQTVVHPNNGLLALERSELWSQAEARRNLKCMWWSERSQSEKATRCVIPTVWCSGKGKIIETVKRSLVARGGEGWWGVVGGAQRIFRVLRSYSAWSCNGGHISLNICQNHRIVQNKEWL